MSTRPNVLLYITDQQRADLMGCMGHPQIKTPHFDALAKRGVLMRNFYIQGTVCMPSRSSILTGKYPCTHGVTVNGTNLPHDSHTMAHSFADAGYHTAVVGRTHVDCSQPLSVLPRENYRGFRECHHTQCYWHGLDPHGEYLNWIKANHPDDYDKAATPPHMLIDREDAHCTTWNNLPDDRTMTAWVTHQSLAVLENHQRQRADQPIFLWAGAWDPHSRFMTAPPWDRMYPPADIPLPVRREGELDELPPGIDGLAMTQSPKPNHSLDDVIRNTQSIYWGTISHIDDQFGRLMQGLEKLDMLDNTIVVFMSDHGDMLGDHWCWAKGPYSYEPALRVPGIIAAPDHLPQSQVTDALIETVDLMPTLLDMTGVETPDNIQGRSCLPTLRGQSLHHRDDAWTEITQNTQMGRQTFSLRTERYRFTHYGDRPYGILFDMETDPNQLHNLWNSPNHQDVKHELQNRMMHRVMANQITPDQRQAQF